MKTKLYVLIFVLILFQIFLPLLTGEETIKPYALVTVSVANMRCQPAYSAEMATQCILGSPLRVIGEKKGWYQVLTPDGYDCWVTGNSLTLLSRVAFNSWIKSPKIIYLQDNGFVFSQPDSNASRVSDLVSGCVFQNKENTGNFIAVSFPDGRSGYVFETGCRDFEDWKQNVQLNEENLIKKATDLMGVPYLWGGTSSKMLDCSGMTKLCFFLNGVIIPRNASRQAEVGERIDIKKDFSNLQKGDLLFFGTPATTEKQLHISHVGFYMGDGFVIHEAGRVHLSSLKSENKLYDQSLANRLVLIRRLTTMVGEKGIIPVNRHPFYRLQNEENEY
ncbi:MAG: C40 family peptidase [Planctomycetaceae bacterium]|jgi:SH3-like domain-containing protein|nr:C40 family peptidase [Planctomycetaceae bacterium]